MIVTRAGRLREQALESDRMHGKTRVVAYELKKKQNKLVIVIVKCQRAKILPSTRALFNLYRNVMNCGNLQRTV